MKRRGEDLLDKKNPRQREQSKAEAELQQDFHVTGVRPKPPAETTKGFYFNFVKFNLPGTWGGILSLPTLRKNDLARSTRCQTAKLKTWLPRTKLTVPSGFSYLERRDEGLGAAQHLAVLEDFCPLDSLGCCKLQKLLTRTRK